VDEEPARQRLARPSDRSGDARRITDLYQALASGRPVQTHDGGDKPVQRWYSIDIDAALDPAVDRDEAIIGVSELSGQESEWEQFLFPLRWCSARRRSGGAG